MQLQTGKDMETDKHIGAQWDRTTQDKGIWPAGRKAADLEMRENPAASKSWKPWPVSSGNLELIWRSRLISEWEELNLIPHICVNVRKIYFTNEEK